MHPYGTVAVEEWEIQPCQAKMVLPLLGGAALQRCDDDSFSTPVCAEVRLVIERIPKICSTIPNATAAEVRGLTVEFPSAHPDLNLSPAVDDFQIKPGGVFGLG